FGTCQAVGRVHNDIDAMVSQGWNGWPALGPGVTKGDEQSELAGIDLRRPGRPLCDRIDVAPEQRIDGSAGEWNVDPFDTLTPGDTFHCDVRVSAGARGAVIDLAGIRLRI